MGKVLVLFDSKSGNTAKMAALVGEGACSVPNTEVRRLSVDEATAEDLLWCDGVALGSPTCMGAPSWKMKRFWDETAGPAWGRIDGKIGCAFSSQGGWGGGAELVCLQLMIMMMNYGLMTFGVPDYVGKQFTLHYGSIVAGEPRSDNESASCRLLGERLAQWVRVHVDGCKEANPVLTRVL